MVKYTIFSDKDIHKQNRELVELHQRCIKTYLVQKSVRASVRNKFFKLYGYYISERNIPSYFFLPVDIFIRALVTNRLNQVSNYITHEKKRRRRRKKS